MAYKYNKKKIMDKLKAAGYDDPEHTIDWGSYSNDISIEEWLNNEYNITLDNLKQQVEQIKAQQEKQKYREQQRIEEEKKKLVQEWQQQKAEKINLKSFEIPKHYIQMAVRGISNGCFLVGEGGIGKSYLAVETIKEDISDFAYLNTSVSPLALYKFIYKNKDKLILLDDVEGVFSDPKSISVLKSALWPIQNKKLLAWETTSDKIGSAPELFEFTGQIIILANKINTKDANLSALISRVNYCRIEFTYEEKITIMKSIIKKDYKNLSYEQRKYILDQIIKKTDETNKHFNFRTLIKAYDFYIYNEDKFNKLLCSILERDEELELIKLMEKRNISSKEKISLFKQITGKCKRTYYYKKKELCKSATKKGYCTILKEKLSEV